MKTLKSLSILFVLLVVSFLVMQCQHDDENVVPVKGPDPVVHGTESISCPDCTPANYDASVVPLNTWYFDKSHSNVMWETQYKGLASILTGRFNTFYLDNLTFKEDKPSDIEFEGHVWLNSVNTGEPNRDGGCLAGNGATSSFKTTLAMTTEDANQATLTSVLGSGRYSSTDAGFLVDANFTFLGITKLVTVKLFYYPQTTVDAAKDYILSGVSGTFSFNPNADFFEPDNSNVGGMVEVRMNLVLRNKLE